MAWLNLPSVASSYPDFPPVDPFLPAVLLQLLASASACTNPWVHKKPTEDSQLHQNVKGKNHPLKTEALEIYGSSGVLQIQ